MSAVRSAAGLPASGVKSRHPHPGVAGVGLAPQAIGSTADVERGGQARFPGLRPTSTRRTTSKADAGASALASLLAGSSAGELIPELATRSLQQLIEMEVAAFLGVDWHERT